MKAAIVMLGLAMVSLPGFGQTTASISSKDRNFEQHPFTQAHDVKTTVPVISVISNDTLVLLLDSIVEENKAAGCRNRWQAFRYSETGKMLDAYIYIDHLDPKLGKRSFEYHANDSVSSIYYYRQVISGYPCINTYENSFDPPLEKEYFTYNSNNLLTEYLLESYGVDWIREFYYYDSIGQLTRVEQRRFDVMTQGQEDYERTLYFYNALGLDTMVYRYIKYPDFPNLIRSSYTEKAYDSLDRLTDEYFFITTLADTNHFRLYETTHYEYDQYGNNSGVIGNTIKDYGTFTDTSYRVYKEYHRCFGVPDSIIQYNGSTSNPDFTDKYRWTYYYSGTSCLPDSSIAQRWLKDSSAYSLGGPTHYHYDSLGNLIREVWLTLDPTGWTSYGERRHYYRWQKISPISVEEPDKLLSQQGGLFVYPNPVTERLHVGLPEGALFETALYDLNGRRVVDRANNATLDLAHLPAGVYLLKVYTNGHLLTRKIMKQ